MLSHDSIIYDAVAITDVLPEIEEGKEIAVSFLPLNHVAAQVFDMYFILYIGGCVYFADRNALKGTLGRTIKKAKPTRFFGVPRVYEKIYEGFVAAQCKASPIAKFLIEKSMTTLKNYHMSSAQTRKSLNFAKHWLASKIVHKIHKTMGLENCKCFFVGGAPVRNELKYFYAGLDMPLIECYGMSETAGGTTFNFDHSILESSGKALSGIEIKIENPDSNGHGEVSIYF